MHQGRFGQQLADVALLLGQERLERLAGWSRSSQSVRSAALSSAAAFAQSTLRVVMHSDLKVLDPIWSGAYIVRNHGYMLYDTLFAMDEQFQIDAKELLLEIECIAR